MNPIFIIINNIEIECLIIISGKTIKIDMSTPKSIYPCLDSFNLLITTPNISNDNYIRLIRVYTSNYSNRYYVNTQKLEYVREFKLPANNLLKFDCQFFAAHFRYYCFVFVALSRNNGAVLINGKPHCRPTTMESIMTSTNPSFEYDIINASHQYEQLRPAGPSYKYNPTKSIVSNILGNSRRVSKTNIFDDNYFDSYDYEENAQSINIKCKCSDSHELFFNLSTVIVTIDIIKCNNNNDNIGYNGRDDDKDSYVRRKYIEKKNLRSFSDTNYGITSTICILDLTERNYKMQVQQLVRRDYPVIYFQSTHFPNLIVREGRLSIDPQLDINNKSQTHFLKSQYLRIESFYTTNITLKLMLLKSSFMKEKSQSFMESLTPIHYTSLVLIALIVISLLVFILMSLTARKRRTVVKIVTPSEGEPTHTSYSYMDQTSLSQFSLADNQSLEMDYYDYLLPFVPRPNSNISQFN